MTGAPQNTRPDLSRMLALLRQELHALKQADMATLQRLAPRKAALLKRLEASADRGAQADGQLLQRVRADASRNAQLFEAALRGLNNARGLLERIKSPRSDQTYARNGARHSVDPPHSTLERRA